MLQPCRRAPAPSRQDAAVQRGATGIPCVRHFPTCTVRCVRAAQGLRPNRRPDAALSDYPISQRFSAGSLPIASIAAVNNWLGVRSEDGRYRLARITPKINGRWYCYQRPLRLNLEVPCPRAILSGFRRLVRRLSRRIVGSPNCCRFSPGVGLGGEASTRTWRLFSCSDLLFLLLPLALLIHSDPVSGSSAAVPRLPRRSAFSWRHRSLTIGKSHGRLSRTTEI
jgi:hypothetical protein